MKVDVSRPFVEAKSDWVESFERVKAWLESPPQNRQEGQVFAGARVVLFKLPPFRYFFEREVFAVGVK